MVCSTHRLTWQQVTDLRQTACTYWTDHCRECNKSQCIVVIPHWSHTDSGLSSKLPNTPAKLFLQFSLHMEKRTQNDLICTHTKLL